MLNRKQLNADSCKMLVLDGCVKLLGRETKDVMYDLLMQIPTKESLQFVFLDTCIEQEVLDVANKVAEMDKFIATRQQWFNSKLSYNFWVDIEKEEHKLQTICDLLDTEIGDFPVLILCNTRRKVEWLSEKLIEQNFPMQVLHGDLAQTEREKVLNSFGVIGTKFLITTNARSLTNSRCRTVINYDLPRSLSDFIDNSSMAGRLMDFGMVVSFATTDDKNVIKELESKLKLDFVELPATIPKTPPQQK